MALLSARSVAGNSASATYGVPPLEPQDPPRRWPCSPPRNGGRDPGARPSSGSEAIDTIVRIVRGYWDLRQAGSWSHTADRRKSQPPLATKPNPEMREISQPGGITFSARTKIAIAAIQRTFITPPTNKSAISIQQQPRQ